jgi:hypothetical protein
MKSPVHLFNKRSTVLACTIAALSFLSPEVNAAGFCNRHDCEGGADATIAADATGWFMNRYDKGSATVREVWESDSGFKVILTVDYTYNGGRRGWAKIELHDGAVYCITFHDFPNECRTHKKSGLSPWG